MVDTQALINCLQGACNSLSDCLSEQGMDDTDMTDDDYDELDNQLFQCGDCGWWCERGVEESDESDICNDCNEKHNED